MPNFYPPFDPDEESGGHGANEAERAVLTALAKDLDDRWRVFHGFNWREADPKQGERIGEADLVVFHPDLGLLVIEVKGGGIKCVDGQWFSVGRYDGTEYPMKKSPFEQARRNRYHIFDRLKGTSLGPDFTADTTLTHTAWFPEITWTAAAPPEVPNGAFILDSRHLTNPASHLRNILRQANPHAKPWDDRRTGILVQSLSPDLNLLVPLGTRISGIRERILRMTEDQVAVSKMLRSQKRLLVEGCAGSGKTLLAAALAREHAAAGKRVLLTCYNKRLAAALAADLEPEPSIEVRNFHELVRSFCGEAGVAYDVPVDAEEQKEFFEDRCAELLLDCSERTTLRYDTIIVDEAFDFRETWWTALEALGGDGFSYYVFYDRNQGIFLDKAAWKPPFAADPMLLDRNVRNTRAISRFAARIGGIPEALDHGVQEGPEPEKLPYGSPAEISSLLSRLVRELTGKQKVAPENIAVLSPYKPGHERVGLADFLKKQEGLFTTELAQAADGRVRIGTIQAFKGLEADVVILCGIDGHLPACSPANLYVGATRARSMLYVIHHEDFTEL